MEKEEYNEEELYGSEDMFTKPEKKKYNQVTGIGHVLIFVGSFMMGYNASSKLLGIISLAILLSGIHILSTF